MTDKKIKTTLADCPESLEWLQVHIVEPGEEQAQIVWEQVDDVQAFLKSGGQCIVNKDLVKHEDFISHSLKRHLEIEKKSIDLDAISNGSLKESQILKMADHSAIGEYSDIIAADAYEAKFNFVKIRNYATKCMSYLSYLNKGDIAFIPIDIEYGYSENRFYLQMHVSVQNFVKEYLVESFGPSDRTHPFKSLLGESFEDTDYLEISHLESAEKIILTSVWFKEIGYETFHPTLILNNIASFEEKAEALAQKRHIKVMKTSITLPSNDLPGNSVDIMGGMSDSKENLIKVKHIVEVIQRIRSGQSEEEKIEDASLSVDHLPTFEEAFQDVSIEDLNEDQKDFIIDCVKKPHELGNLEKEIDQILDKFDGEKYVNVFSDALTGLTTEQVNNYFNSSKSEEEAFSDLVGSRTDISDEIWQLKKIKIIESFKENTKPMIEREASRVELNEEMLTIISSELEKLREECIPLVNDLGDQTVQQMIQTKIAEGDVSKEALELELMRQAQKFDNIINDYKEKSRRSLKVINMMKGQIAAMAEAEAKHKKALEEARSRGEELDQQSQISQLKLELKSALNDVKNRESTIDKIRQSTDQLIKLKDQEITKLKRSGGSSPIPSSENEKVPLKKTQLEAVEEIVGDEDPTEVILKTKEENKNLKNQIEVLSKRISNMNENMQKGGDEKLNRAESMNEKLKETSQMQAKQLQELRGENEKLNRLFKGKNIELRKLEEEHRLLKKIKMNQDATAPKEDKSGNLEKAVQEAKANEKFAGEQLKAAQTKIKSYEQKIKFLTAQVDAAKKGGGRGQTMSNGGGAASKKDGAANLKVKQLETLKEKAEKSLEKSTKDLAQAKKENLALKNEIGALKNKLKELERKSGKKAA